MKKLISRVCCLCCVVLVLAACLPLSAFAVDPVSAGVMANAFAQAIAAYGASNGVAMAWDVTSTDGIGETMHDLWKDFRSGTQSADDYATLAAALFPELYYKASSVVGGVSDVYTVGYNISSTYAEEFDNFYNWLLSGPAEMVKVDNAYYQFASSQIGANAVPIEVNSVATGPFTGNELPFWQGDPLSSNAAWNQNKAALWNMSLPGFVTSDPDTYRVYIYQSLNRPTYSFFVGSNLYFVSDTRDVWCNAVRHEAGTTSYGILVSSSSGIKTSNYHSEYNVYYSNAHALSLNSVSLPRFNSLSEGLAAVPFATGTTSVPDTVGVKAATNTGVAEFPDTTDPNYEAVGKQIPSTVPWDNTAYGDGTGTLTDAQAGAIAAGADTVIARDGVLDLVEADEVTDEPGTDDPPTTDPDDYAVPGLADIFPFCIPFDIYNFLSALAANPVAPHFTATLDFPEAVGGTQTIDIDFDSPTWNQLAQLLRLLELLAFIIGLALLTRSMFIRG